MSPDRYRSVDGLIVEHRDSVLRLRLDRPSNRNAINDEMMLGLVSAIDAAERDEDVRAIYIEGSGDHFCGGADIVARNADPTARPRAGSIQRRLPSHAHLLVSKMCTVQVPIVCAVRGWAAGIGLHIAAAADMTIAAEDARFWEPFSSRGFTPDSGGTWLLPRLVGLARARELLLLGRELTGIEATDWGLIHGAVPGDRVGESALEVLGTLASGPTVSLGLTKWLLATSGAVSLDDQLRNEAFAMEISARSEDFREGMLALGERRPPVYRGR
jgi:2-(1,2-epoxy-1,2-dihydrophenyl)acetyl-CoA isomerase